MDSKRVKKIAKDLSKNISTKHPYMPHHELYSSKALKKKRKSPAGKHSMTVNYPISGTDGHE